MDIRHPWYFFGFELIII